VNDELFRLVTVSPSLTVIDGWKVVITSTNLLTVDPDTPPDRLRYDVITEPEVGRLRMIDRVDRVTSFSQADVNDGRVEFVHDVGRGPGPFVFQV